MDFYLPKTMENSLPLTTSDLRKMYEKKRKRKMQLLWVNMDVKDLIPMVHVLQRLNDN